MSKYTEFSEVRLKTRQDIATELGISTRTLQRKIRNADLDISRNVYLSEKEVEKIKSLFR